mgnify:CR=1
MPFAAIILGVYLLLVVTQGNSLALVRTVKDSKGFLPWIIAVAVLTWLYKNPIFRPAVAPLMGAVGVAFALNTLPQLQSQIGGVWKTLK